MDNRNDFCFGCFAPKSSDYKCKVCGYVYDLKEGPEQSHLFPGTVLNNRYIVGKVIGAGGFGITYIAFDPKLQVRLAIKEFFPRQIASRNRETKEIIPFGESEKTDFINGLKYFLHEARSAAMFETHQNIVGVKDMFEENLTAYMVMPYINGTPFDTYIAKNGGKVSFSIALSVLAPIMDALSTIHNAKLLHRDISPENIFITEEGVPKLLDFGSARPTVASETLSMTPVIKEGYAPLEQYSRQGDQGPSTDIYSMAATIYKAVSGSVPPPAMERFTSDNLIELSSVCSDIPSYAEKAIVKALSLRASDRFQTMNEFILALTKGKSVEPLILNSKIKKKSGNGKLIATISSALIVVTGIALFFIMSQKKVPETQPAADQVKMAEKITEPLKVPEKIIEPVKKIAKEPAKEIPVKTINESVKTKKYSKKTVEKEEPLQVEQPREVRKTEGIGISSRSGNFIFPKAAEKGLSAEQYFKDGFKYELAQNPSQAVAYYTESCNMKFTNACYRLGKINDNTELLSKARSAFEKECQKGTGSSCISLAEMMLRGEGGTKSPFEAVTTLAKQCSSGSVTGCFMLAGIWEKGENINKDLEKARKYYGHACENGSKEGCFKYAEMLDSGTGGPADAEKAKEFYAKACSKGHLKACMKKNQ
ncbi:MAG TPA: protein kinase [bacterium]|nr:protein kinase [bacterium]HPS29770.1 protein kinase [bacterium]